MRSHFTHLRYKTSTHLETESSRVSLRQRWISLISLAFLPSFSLLALFLSFLHFARKAFVKGCIWIWELHCFKITLPSLWHEKLGRHTLKRQLVLCVSLNKIIKYAHSKLFSNGHDDVFKILAGWNVSKDSGPTDIHPKIICYKVNFLAPVSVSIIQSCLVPSEWRWTTIALNSRMAYFLAFMNQHPNVIGWWCLIFIWRGVW